MAPKRKRKLPSAENVDKAVLVDDTILRDMLDVGTLQPLLESFGQMCGIGASIFAPSGVRIGETAHYYAFCQSLYNTKEGQHHCLECDRSKIKKIREGKVFENPYRCHAGLIEFCESIFCKVAGQMRLIGVFFGGQVLYEDVKPTDKFISKLKDVAKKCNVDSDELLARYMQVPRLPRKKIDEIRAWMKQFSNLIGLLVEKKVATQKLLLDVIQSANDPNYIVEAIQRHFQPAAVSIFLQRDGVLEKFTDRIFLVATTSKELAIHFPVEEDLNRISYQSGEGFTGWVYKTGKVLHIPDVRNKNCYPKYPYPAKWTHKVPEIPKLIDAQAFLGAPIRADDGKVIGVIRETRLKSHPGFRNDEIELLTGIASLVGVAITKAQLYKEHAEKVEALNQAQGLLRTLTEPETNLESITNSMVQELGKTYVKKGKWEAVYVVQHLKSSKQFRIVAYFPSDLADRYRRSPFPDTTGVVGRVFKTGKFFPSKNCIRDGVNPTTPWTSVICAPIFHEEKMWGAVDLCGNNLSQTDVDLAAPKITQFAENMSLVCRLSEILDAKNTAALLASNVLSLNLEAHEVYKSLESSKITVDHLCELVEGEEKRIVEDLAKEIDESLSWADVCLELGRYIKLCQVKPDEAVEVYRKRHLPIMEDDISTYASEKIWQVFDLRKVAGKALNSVRHLGATHQTKVKSVLPKEALILGDENLLYRAIRNLLENAIVHGSKKIEGNQLTYLDGVPMEFSISLRNEGKTARIIVQDKGVGMNSKALISSREVYSNPTLIGSSSLASGFGTMVVAFAVSVHLGVCPSN